MVLDAIPASHFKKINLQNYAIFDVYHGAEIYISNSEFSRGQCTLELKLCTKKKKTFIDIKNSNKKFMVSTYYAFWYIFSVEFL